MADGDAVADLHLGEVDVIADVGGLGSLGWDAVGGGCEISTRSGRAEYRATSFCELAIWILATRSRSASDINAANQSIEPVHPI